MLEKSPIQKCSEESVGSSPQVNACTPSSAMQESYGFWIQIDIVVHMETVVKDCYIGMNLLYLPNHMKDVEHETGLKCQGVQQTNSNVIFLEAKKPV